jgi:hypothetical protein
MFKGWGLIWQKRWPNYFGSEIMSPKREEDLAKERY